MPRIVSVWLPRWPIQRFLRAQAGRSGSPDRPASPEAVDARRPFVLTVEASGGPRIGAANKAAEAEGLAVGGLVADARARAPGLQTRPLDREADSAALHRLGLWAMRYTPSVAAYRQADGADGLFLDITGASHLAGGEAALLADIVRRLRPFSLGARTALADTPGAAWALSRCHAQAAVVLPAGDDPAGALACLPMAGLRLPDDLCLTLQRLGFRRIGDLLGKERAPFAARFEPVLLKRLDQAMGRREEALIVLEPPPLHHRSRQLLDPIVSQPAVVHVASRLMKDLVPALAQEGLGARTLRLRLFRVDGEVRTIHIGLAAATRDPAHVARLVELDLERLGETIDAGFGFETVSLTVTTTEKIGSRQARLTLRDGTMQAPVLDLAERQSELIDALRQRLGPQAVRQIQPVARHDPAFAEAAVEAGTTPPAWPQADPARLRPPLFLERPEPLQILATGPDGLPGHFRWRGTPHRIVDLQGPERIAGPWWEETAPPLPTGPSEEAFGWGKPKGDKGGSGKAAAQARPKLPDSESPRSVKRSQFENTEAERTPRPTFAAPPQHDYYVAETQAGQRFWLCCEGPERPPRQQTWFMRGLFA
ncbi:Y-family DNA polymerase [Labrys monachus]|uniref:Protein ImuB n=1 Tax=Labrys monachus TaxID=217067 RepID=A0ABU0FIP1_9HYPH|nr:DNA polymerase Y family protein [Labrys monachus]MDQ0394482.1 protein ImuB [Labrys monachus]